MLQSLDLQGNIEALGTPEGDEGSHLNNEDIDPLADDFGNISGISDSRDLSWDYYDDPTEQHLQEQSPGYHHVYGTFAGQSEAPVDQQARREELRALFTLVPRMIYKELLSAPALVSMGTPLPKLTPSRSTAAPSFSNGRAGRLCTSGILGKDGASVVPAVVTFPGAVLVADITGFTRMTELLAANEGGGGVEKLTECINQYFSCIIDIVYLHGQLVPVTSLSLHLSFSMHFLFYSPASPSVTSSFSMHFAI